MRKASQGNKSQQSTLESLRGGKLSESVARRLVAEVRRNRLAALKERSAIRQQAQKYLGQIRKPIATGNGKTAQAISGLRELSDRLAKQKLVLPAYQKMPGGILDASYTLGFTPPYTAEVNAFTFTQLGNPTCSATLDPNQGELNCSVETDFKSPSDGEADCQVGIYFRPMFGPAIADIRVDLQGVFSWVVNVSTLGKAGASTGQASVLVHQYDSDFTLLQFDPFMFWILENSGEPEIDFDFGSMPSSAELRLQVSSAYYYFVTVALNCHASGTGWPGSIATANASLRVPSITVEVTFQPELEPRA